MFGNPGMLLNRETSKPKKTSETLRRFGGYFKPYWFILLIAAGLIVFSTWTQVLAPDLTGQAVDCYLTPAVSGTSGQAGIAIPGQATSITSSNCWYDANAATLSTSDRVGGLLGLVLRLAGLFVLGSLATGLTFLAMAWAGQNVLKNIRVALFKHLQRLSLGYYSRHEVGDLMSRITNDSETIQQAISFALINVVSGILLIVWVGYNMLTKDLPYAIVSLIVLPFMLIVTSWFSGQARKAFRRSRIQMGNVNAELQQSITGVREVQAFNREDENIEAFKTTNASNRDANIKAVAWTSALGPTLEALGYVSIALVVGVGGIFMLNNGSLFGTTISLGLVITFLAYVQRLNMPIQQIGMLWATIQSAIAGAERIFGLLDEKPDIEDKPNALKLPAIKGEVVFNNVWAEYKKDEPVLRGVNFEAKAGQTIAIVGPTGAGKTTIINLIPRFYDVSGGSVTIDGHDVRDVTGSSLREQIGIVLQDSFLFSDTVMNNIRFGRPDASDEEVIAAAKLARADTLIERLPDKYKTVLGERGRGLSQGQRQLIAIARAALVDPRILILDEATSSVDTRTERLIQAALEKLLEGRTSFVVAHRLSTIKHADQILVLKDGGIVEQGTFQELLAVKGHFYDLYMSQFRRQEQGAETTVGATIGAGAVGEIAG
ncbi:MAG: ABC transporter ATP-binding protein [Chloroflexi bacterium]|nr:ABC transporter ATP-binding protein [Chloroflexota bacterium]OJV97808.1 MAG: ABC transporter [Chloroflexi bacterium 54-19]